MALPYRQLPDCIKYEYEVEELTYDDLAKKYNAGVQTVCRELRRLKTNIRTKLDRGNNSIDKLNRKLLRVKKIAGKYIKDKRIRNKVLSIIEYETCDGKFGSEILQKQLNKIDALVSEYGPKTPANTARQAILNIIRDEEV